MYRIRNTAMYPKMQEKSLNGAYMLLKISQVQ